MLAPVKEHEVLGVYDASYASEYDQKYISNPEMLPATLYQTTLLKKLLGKSQRWLDLGCGTGFYLSLFPEVSQRLGLDLSPHMLRVAKKRAPGARFERGSFLAAHPRWVQRWQLVSCTWWAYCLVPSIHEIEQLVSNMASWVTRDGTVFVPLCNPRTFSKHAKYPPVDRDRPGVRATGLIWSWHEADGKVHAHMVSPFPETMRQLFERHFGTVEIVTAASRVVPRGYWSTDFLIARKPIEARSKPKQAR